MGASSGVVVSGGILECQLVGASWRGSQWGHLVEW